MFISIISSLVVLSACSSAMTPNRQAVKEQKNDSFDDTLYTKIYTSPPQFRRENVVIRAVSEDICQIKVGFLQFEINQPDSDGNCNQGGSVTFTGQTNIVPQICGFNNGQHVHLSYDTEKNDIEMILQNSLEDGFVELNLTQIRCDDSHALAPPGCLQYIPKDTREVCTFNYGGQHLANQHYSVCFDQPTCYVNWQRRPGPINVSPYHPNPYNGCLTNGTEDYIFFPGQASLTSDDGIYTMYFDAVCGNGTVPVTYENNPIVAYGVVPALEVHFNDNENLEAAVSKVIFEGRAGFCLDYTKTC